jgi:hypothetical protein
MDTNSIRLASVKGSTPKIMVRREGEDESVCRPLRQGLLTVNTDL